MGKTSSDQKRRWGRRLAVALLAEFTAGGLEELRWQRRRMRVAIDHAVALESVAPKQKAQAQIPHQRSRSESPETQTPAQHLRS
jgi:hypothetical protein